MRVAIWKLEIGQLNWELRAQSNFCSFLLSVFKSGYLKNSFIEIVLVFLPVERKANILHVYINFTGNLFFGFGRYCGKVFPKPTVSHPFWVPAFTRNVLSIFFPCWLLVNGCRNKRVPTFWLCFIGFETINVYIFFIKMSCFGSNLLNPQSGYFKIDTYLLILCHVVFNVTLLHCLLLWKVKNLLLTLKSFGKQYQNIKQK